MKLKSILSSLLLLSLCVSVSAADVNKRAKYTPGHYITVGEGGSVTHPKWDKNPNVQGVQKRYTWRNLEPKKGKYDFSEIREDLRLLSKNDKKLVIFFNDKTFKSDIEYVPDYLQEYVYAVTKGKNPLRWAPEYKARFKALIDALAKEFDKHPNIEGFTFQESALAFPDDVLAKIPAELAFSPQVYADALIETILYASDKFKNSQIFWFANFIPKDKTGSELKRVTDAVCPRGVVLSGPDILPHRESLNRPKGVYELHKQYIGVAPRGNSMQADSYKHHKNDLSLHVLEPLHEEGYISVEDLFYYARDVMKLNYIFWVYIFDNNKVPHNNFDDAIDVINKYPAFN